MKKQTQHAALLNEAVQHHVAGRIDAAENIYRRVMSEDPGNADALNLLGVIAQGRGHLDQAKALYQRALAAGPRVPDIHFNLANLLAVAGDVDAAIAAYQRAIALWPDFVKAHLGLGAVFHGAGQFEAAAACFRAAVKHAPQDVHGYVNLGLCELKRARLDDAVACFAKAVEIAPADAELRVLLTGALADAGHLPDAVAQARQAVTLAPRAEYYSVLGDVLRRAQDLDGALVAHETAIKAKPADPTVLHNYAAALHAAKRLEQAEEMFKRALAAAPDLIAAHIGLAKVYEHRGLFDEAVATLRNAQARDPASADIRFKLAVLQLAGGDFREGWANYAYRMADSKASHPRRATPPPYWSGEDLTGKRILVWTEQGLGDEILFASMLPDVIARAGACVIECSPRMAPVFARSFPNATVVAAEKAHIAVTPAGDADYQIAAGDLGRFLRRDFTAFPSHRGYLKADPARAAALRARYQALKPGNRVVGLSWRSGNKDIGALKSAVLAEWADVLTAPGVTFVNLQYGNCDSDLAAVRARLGVDIFHDSDINPLENVDDFFAQVAAMDLVISTSNTTVHVAGSQGIPVWLIDAGGLWYWFRERGDSPWYPVMRIFRSNFQWVSGGGATWWAQAIAAAAQHLRRADVFDRAR